LGTREGEEIQVAIPLTHQLLADLSHSHRSTVTTILNDWIYAGILVEGEVGIRILEPGQLRGGEAPLR
jgi:CRP-like cAMP-binding protein